MCKRLNGAQGMSSRSPLRRVGCCGWLPWPSARLLKLGRVTEPPGELWRPSMLRAHPRAVWEEEDPDLSLLKAPWGPWCAATSGHPGPRLWSQTCACEPSEASETCSANQGSVCLWKGLQLLLLPLLSRLPSEQPDLHRGGFDPGAWGEWRWLRVSCPPLL